MPADHRDIVIETLADSEAELLERIASLEASQVVYHTLLVAALDALVDVTLKHRRERDERQRLQDQYSALCERLLLAAGADDSDVAA